MKRKSLQSLSKTDVRALFLKEQGFSCEKKQKTVNAKDLKLMMSKLHVLQLDAVPVVARTQYIPIFSRLGIYDCNLLDEVAYKMDNWFECWAHEASLVPVEYEPLFRWSKQRAKQGYTWKALYRFAVNEKQYIEDVYNELQQRGKLKAKDFFDQRRLPKSSWGGYSYAARALDWLFRIGQVGIRRVGNFEKEFDCIENIVPKKIHQQKTPSVEQAIKELLLLSVQALAVATEDAIVDYFRLPPRIAKPYLKQLYEDKKLERWQVESWSKPAFSLPQLPAVKNISMDKVTALLSPFDPVVWHRPRTERLFDFFYRIEIYIPQEKRKWGYYVLPFMMEGDLVARVDVKADRTSHILHVLAAYVEKDMEKNKVAHALSHELKKMSQWLNLKKIQLGRKGDLMNSLRREF